MVSSEWYRAYVVAMLAGSPASRARYNMASLTTWSWHLKMSMQPMTYESPFCSLARTVLLLSTRHRPRLARSLRHR